MRDAFNKRRYLLAALTLLVGARIASASFVGMTECHRQLSTNRFDACNRLVELAMPGGLTNRWAFNAVGLMTGATDNVGASLAGYDPRNRLTWWQDHNGLAVSNVYNTAGNLRRVRYPDGKTVQYNYDLLNRCTNVVDWAGRTTRLTYDAGSRLTQATYPNGVQSFYLYDKDGRITNYWHKTNGTNSVARGLVRDAIGRKTLETATAGLEAKPSDIWRTYNNGPCDQLRTSSRCTAYVQENWRITTPAWRHGAWHGCGLDSHDGNEQTVCAIYVVFGRDAKMHVLA